MSKNYQGYYLVLPDEKGNRKDTKTAAIMTEVEVKEYQEQGYILLEKEQFCLLIGNRGGGEHIINPKTGEITEAPPYEPTVEEKLAALDAEYEAKISEVNNAILLAVAENDTELQAELVAEKTALKAEYEQKRSEL